MRFIGKFSDPAKAEKFSRYLSSQGIENRVEKSVNTDWGSDEYGSQSALVWIMDEEKLDEAKVAIDKYHLDPQDLIFSQPSPPTPQPTRSEPSPPPKPKRASKVKQQEGFGPITLYILLVCSLLFLFNEFNSPSYTKITQGLPYTPVLSSPLRKELLFDYPKAYTYIDKIVTLYGANKFETVDQLPPEGKALYQKFLETPVWRGLYYYVLESFNPPAIKTPVGELMEKIREGEIWRTLSPCLMHADIFHILFNMLWLIVLGKEMESKLSKPRYILAMAIMGLVSNFAQYMMSGSNFIGYSGILCGMLAFIWMRQKLAPWEGYKLQQGTFSFMLFFVLAIVGVQTFAFLLEAANISQLPINIANTAHVTGGLTGAFLGRLSYFELKSKVK